MMRRKVNRTWLELMEGDITALDTDAIVNAANGHLAHGGGVAGAISRRGGIVIQQESSVWVRAHGPVPTGSAAITSGGNLPARYVIHAVGPIYRNAGESAPLLASAVKASLQMADEHALHSIALPAISTGIFGYPLQDAAGVMLRAAVEYARGQTGLERILFCLYNHRAYQVFEDALYELLPDSECSEGS